jgi:hypothetical protein
MGLAPDPTLHFTVFLFLFSFINFFNFTVLDGEGGQPGRKGRHLLPGVNLIKLFLRR